MTDRRSGARLLAVLAGLVGALAGDVLADAPLRLAMPVDCVPRETCFIQSHVDLDPGDGFRDFACGDATYDGHTGVDFRLLSAAAAARGVAVRAAAGGVVKGRRDGMADRFAGRDDAAVKSRECGNGVVIDHGGGWETQYCHLRQGSVAVEIGERVERGRRLGDVGYSGLAEFAHLHLTVRRNGAVVDPFSGQPVGAPCRREATGEEGLFEPEVARAFAYANGEILTAGFAGGEVLHALLEHDHGRIPVASRSAAALVLYVRTINLRTGDRIRLVAEGPDGFRIDHTTEPLDRRRASATYYAGRRAGPNGWTGGTYTGSATIVRDGRAVASRTVTLRLD